MSDIDHNIHTDAIIVDADKHFVINTVNRAITPDPDNKKLTLMQYDNKSERYSFDIDRIIDGHDLINCDRVQVHFINIGSNKQKHPGLYLVDDVHVNDKDENKITFTWLISQDATQLSGILSFLISFECTDGDTILYRWSSSIYNSIQITAGMDNDNTIVELYADELLAWEHQMATEVIPELVDLCYVDRNFATSEEVAEIFSMNDNIPNADITIIPTDYIKDATVDNNILTITKSDDSTITFSGGASMTVDNELSETSENPVQNKVVYEALANIKTGGTSIIVDETPTENSSNPVASGGVKTYVDNAIQSAITSALGGDY